MAFSSPWRSPAIPTAYARLLGALQRVRPAQGVVVLPRRRRQRGSDPGGPDRALQGDPRLPLRPRVELPQLRRAVHHAPDHHGRQDGDAQQALAAQPLRLVLGARRHRRRRRGADARRAARRLAGQRPGQARRSPRRSCARSSAASRRASRSSSRACSRSTSTGAPTSEIGERLGCDTKTVDNALQRVKRKVGAHLDERAVLD